MAQPLRPSEQTIRLPHDGDVRPLPWVRGTLVERGSDDAGVEALHHDEVPRGILQGGREGVPPQAAVARVGCRARGAHQNDNKAPIPCPSNVPSPLSS